MPNRDNRKTEDSQLQGSLKDDQLQSTSERKIQANRQNAMKSTGPRTERGKRNSSLNALKHGLLAKNVPVQDDGDREALEQFARSLQEKYGRDGDLQDHVLIELAIVYYWRLGRGLDAESVSIIDMAAITATSQHTLEYNKTNVQALIRILEKLEQSRMRRIRSWQATFPGVKDSTRWDNLEHIPYEDPASDDPQIIDQ
jgi:hypothetical protein